MWPCDVICPRYLSGKKIYTSKKHHQSPEMSWICLNSTYDPTTQNHSSKILPKDVFSNLLRPFFISPLRSRHTHRWRNRWRSPLRLQWPEVWTNWRCKRKVQGPSCVNWWVWKVCFVVIKKKKHKILWVELLICNYGSFEVKMVKIRDSRKMDDWTQHPRFSNKTWWLV